MLGAAAAAWLVAGRILRPLRDVADTARASPTPTCPAASRSSGEADELAELVRTVNAMLDRVETGVAAQRRFLDDAGHELRTPITIVRGHLEVLDPADPDDVRADRRAGRRRAGPDEPDGVGPAAARPRRAAGVRAARSRRRRRADRGGRSRRSRGSATGTGCSRPPRTSTPQLDPQRITQAWSRSPTTPCRYTGPGDRIGARHRSWRAAGCGSGSPTPAPASPRTTARGSSSGSPAAARRPPLRRRRARACRSCRPSPSRTAVEVLLDSVPGRGRHLHRRHADARACGRTPVSRAS